MAYRRNPFLERMSEKTTSDQEFVRLFSPKILECLPDDSFSGAVHLFTSPPGAGKTTLLRAFTPTALRSFWNNRNFQGAKTDSFKDLVARGVMHEHDGPQLLGVLLSCASGYADLPSGATHAHDGIFRALFDCRAVLRSLRSVAALLGMESTDELASVELQYEGAGIDLKSIPTTKSAVELVVWAEACEKGVYAQLDSISDVSPSGLPAHVRFESVLWLQSVRFFRDGKEIAPRRLLMVDDLHKLRKKQRGMLIEELVELRLHTPVWLAQRSIALGTDLISQGARDGRDLKHYSLEDIWNSTKEFEHYASNILDRRMDVQQVVPPAAFSAYLRDQLSPQEVDEYWRKGVDLANKYLQDTRHSPKYSEWVSHIEEHLTKPGLESLQAIAATQILIARDESKRQLTLELAPLSTDELEYRDSAQVQKAAEIFNHDLLKVPYYFGLERLCILATSNVEELLMLAAALYDGMLAKQVLRRQTDVEVSPQDQEKRIKETARKKRDFIPKNHTEGTRAQRLLDAIGAFCRGKTFQPNAPYAPGVTGVRVSDSELFRLAYESKRGTTTLVTLQKVLAECVAENLLITRTSSASTARDGGTVYYLNRTLCAYFDLPLQYGGWQEVTLIQLIDWMEIGFQPSRQRRLGE